MVSHNVVKYVSKIDCPIHNQTACQELDAWIKHNDPFLETRVHRKIRRILEASEGKNARKYIQQFSPEIYPSLDFFLEGIHINKKEILEASCFYQQLQRVFTRRERQVDFIIDMCAGNGLNGVLWVLYNTAQHVYFIDKKEDTKYATAVRRRLDELGYNALYSYICQDITDLEQMQQEIDKIKKNHKGKSGIITAMHACGTLTDKIILYAQQNNMSFAVVPCCQKRGMPSLSPLSKEQNQAFADYFSSEADYIDLLRLIKVRQGRYDTEICAIPLQVTHKNRILMGFPN